MGVKVAAAYLQWSQPILPQSPSPSQTLASAISSPASKRRSRRGRGAAAVETAILCLQVPQRLKRSALFGTGSAKLHRSQSLASPKELTSGIRPIRRVWSASLQSFSDEEFSKKIQELALGFQLSGDDEHDETANDDNSAADWQPEIVRDSDDHLDLNLVNSFDSFRLEEPSFVLDSVEPPWEEIVPDSTIERKANSVDLPLSLRIIKRKIRWQQGIREARESACCSVKKAFSSLVFMIRELHSFTLHLRELLFLEDLQGILDRVQKEMHASFVWLFQQVFSHTPTLMVYVMILLANFTVYSMGNNTAIAASPPPGSYAAKTEISSIMETQDQKPRKFDSSSIKLFSISSSSGGKSTSIGGNSGGGGKTPPVASGTDGDGLFDGSNHFKTIVPDGASQLSSFGSTRETVSVSRQDSSREEELSVWNSIVEEAQTMQASLRDQQGLDHETMERLVSPVNVKIEADDYVEYSRTELVYLAGLAQEPNNPLLLANYAQFLYLVTHDYDRAEKYFKRALGVEPADPEAYSKYALFLWSAKKDLWAAEEAYLEAISADPSNSYYAANYAHFLWNTGGDETCFPLDSPDTNEA